MTRIRHSLHGTLLLALLLASGCGWLPGGDRPLLCYVGGTMVPVMEEIAKAYQADTGIEVEIDYGGSGVLLTRIKTEKKGDLFVCHDPFLDELMLKAKLGGDAWTISRITPVMVVQKGNPKNIRDLNDLLRPEVKLTVTDYEYSTLGHMIETMFRKVGVADLETLQAQKEIVTFRSGGRTADTVVNRKFDAAIVWDAVAFLRRGKAETIPIPPGQLPQPGVDAVTSASGKLRDISRIRVTLTVLKCSKKPEAAREFASFIMSERGRQLFRDYGFAGTDAAVQEFKDGERIGGAPVPPVNK